MIGYMKIRNFFDKQEKGQSLVELALIFVFMLVLVIGTIDFGVAFFHWMTLRDAAEEGAVFASLMPSQTEEIECRIRTADLVYTPTNKQNRLPEVQDPDCAIVVGASNSILKDVDIQINGQTCRGITNGVANSVTVELIYDYNFVFPIPTSLLGSNANDFDHVTLRARVTNTVLYPECK